MELLNEEFNKLSDQHPEWSSHTILINLVMKKKFSDTTIKRWFDKLVEKDDYDKDNKKNVLEYLVSCSRAKSAKKVVEKANDFNNHKSEFATGRT